MTKQERIIDILKRMLPSTIVVLASLMPFYSFIMPGIFGGTDAYAHFPYVADLIYGIKHGFTGLSGGHLITGIYAYNVYQFYAPLPHYAVAYLTVAFEWAGINMMDSFKIVILASSISSNIVTYLLARKITKSEKLGVIFGVLYAFFPYRLYCLMYRWAFPEAIAMGFIPLVLYGMYRILNDEKPMVSAYIVMIIGVACLVLSHPYTALITAVAVVIYFLANIKKVINVAKKKESWIYIPCALLIIVGLVGVYVFPMIGSMNSGYYRLSDNEIMWTNVPHIQESMLESWFFVGLLNFNWLDKVLNVYGWSNTGDTASKWILELIVFVVVACIATIVDLLVKKKLKKPIRVLISAGIVLVPIALIMPRIEVLLASIILFICYAFVDIYPDEGQEKLSREAKNILKEPNTYASIVLIIWSFLLILSPKFWEIMPEIFYMGQFAWRAWSICGALLIFLFMYVASLAKGRNTYIKIVAFVASMILVLAQGPIDKRMAQANGNGNVLNYTEEQLMHIDMIGCQDEYMPIVFFESGYTPTYSNSLYTGIRYNIHHHTGFAQGIENYETAFLEGAGTMTVSELNTPNVKFELEVTSDEAYIQLPQFYYDGYKITASGKSILVEDEDGLISFHIEKGNYTVALEYIGPKTYRVARPFFYISIAGTVSLGIGGYFLRKKKEII
ncbi:MAG: hypothetical protein MJ238_00315 [Bacilli bacterium]|nr:hypothetical protein [Bacilli bacterium]